MNDPLQNYREAVAALQAAAHHTVECEQLLRDAQETEARARVVKTKAERAMHAHVLQPQQLPLGVTPQ